MTDTNERNIDPVTEMVRIADSVLHLPLQGFKQSFRSPTSEKIIYDSEWCRISLVWGGWDQRGGNSMHILYGRLHAPDERSSMIWNGEECRCWHRIEYALHFLDGRTPTDAAELDYSHSIKEPFQLIEVKKKFNRRQPEWIAEIHATIWKQYKDRVFQLFDLRNSQMWGEYRQFLKEVYDRKGRIPGIEPPLDKVC